MNNSQRSLVRVKLCAFRVINCVWRHAAAHASRTKPRIVRDCNANAWTFFHVWPLKWLPRVSLIFEQIQLQQLAHGGGGGEDRSRLLCANLPHRWARVTAPRTRHQQCGHSAGCSTTLCSRSPRLFTIKLLFGSSTLVLGSVTTLENTALWGL